MMLFRLLTMMSNPGIDTTGFMTGERFTGYDGTGDFDSLALPLFMGRQLSTFGELCIAAFRLAFHIVTIILAHENSTCTASGCHVDEFTRVDNPIRPAHPPPKCSPLKGGHMPKLPIDLCQLTSSILSRTAASPSADASG